MWRQAIAGLFCAGFLLLSACGGQDAARISEVSAIQSRESSGAIVRAESQNRAQRVREMERDFVERQRFYEALNGAFSGEIPTEWGKLPLRLFWSSVLPPVPATERTRTPEELIHDLNQQSLSIQIVQGMNPQGSNAVECTIEGVRPDLVRGLIRVVSRDCRSSYVFRIAETEEQAREYARRILSGDALAVRELYLDILPGSQLRQYSVRLERR